MSCRDRLSSAHPEPIVQAVNLWKLLHFAAKSPFWSISLIALRDQRGGHKKPSCFEGLRACFGPFSRFGHSESSSHLCCLHSCERRVKTLDRYSVFCLTISLGTSITSINTSSCFTSLSHLLLFHYSDPCRNMLRTSQLKIHTICSSRQVS